MEGLFQILIILFFIVASIFDAVSRNKKKQEQKDRMESEEAAEGSAVEGMDARPGSPGRPPPRPRPTPMEGRRKAPTGEPAPRTTASGPAGSRRTASQESSSRETADQMIPEDFWAVLTGQAPARKAPKAPKAPVPEEAGTEGWNVTAEAGRSESARWEAGASVSGSRGAETAPDEGATSTRRSSRWMEGLDADEEGRRAGGERRPVPAASSRSFPKAPPPPPRPVSPFGRRADPMDEPGGDLEDISRGEIGDGRGAMQGAVDLGGAGARRRGASASPFVRLVASGRQEDLQSAIVLREVLGTPVASRSVSEAPGGWRWEER